MDCERPGCEEDAVFEVMSPVVALKVCGEHADEWSADPSEFPGWVFDVAREKNAQAAR
jgi:hypothetical protein